MQTVADIDLLGINGASLSVRGAPQGTLKILGKSVFLSNVQISFSSVFGSFLLWLLPLGHFAWFLYPLGLKWRVSCCLKFSRLQKTSKKTQWFFFQIAERLLGNVLFIPSHDTDLLSMNLINCKMFLQLFRFRTT